ncbi:MAG: serine hydroxymethyltransferase [Halobacteria archaeon]
MASRKGPRRAPAGVRKVFEATLGQHRLLRGAIPLIASENVTSLTVRSFLTTDFSHRYAEGKVGERYYQGCQYVDEVEAVALEAAKRLFRAEHANVQPISGMNANLAAFGGLAQPGDTLMSLKVSHGGHISHARFSTAGLRGLKVEYHAFDPASLSVDADASAEKIREVRPKVVVLGGSLILFPHPVRELREAASEVGARLMFDGAHVMGLIAGGKFQDPLREGADLLTGSTHKTLPGPQGGMILCTREVADAVDAGVYPGTTSNHHLHHLAGLAVALEEMRLFGKAYARAIVENAKALAAALHEGGMKVLAEHRGFTESHQVAADVSAMGGGTRVAENLERCDIIVNKNLLPWDPPGASTDPSGIRIGSQEVTRLGFGKSEMEALAGLILRAARGKELAKVKRDVRELRRPFQRVRYSLDDLYFPRGEAYEWMSKPARPT